MEIRPCKLCGGKERYAPRNRAKMGQCKGCARRRATERAKLNPEAHNAAGRKWKANNPERVLESNSNYRNLNRNKVRAASIKWKISNRLKANASVSRYRRRHPERVRLSLRRSRLKAYGLTPESFEAKLVSQNYRCPICGPESEITTTNLVVDHCHKSGKVRDLLCSKHNSGLGLFSEDAETLLRAAEYILKWY